MATLPLVVGLWLLGSQTAWAQGALPPLNANIDGLLGKLMVSIQDLMRLPIAGINESVTSLFWKIASLVALPLWSISLCKALIDAYFGSRWLQLAIFLIGSVFVGIIWTGGSYSEVSTALDHLAQSCIAAAWQMVAADLYWMLLDAVVYFVIFTAQSVFWGTIGEAIVSKLPVIGGFAESISGGMNGINGSLGPLLTAASLLLIANCALFIANLGLSYFVTLLNVARLPLALAYLLCGFTRDSVFRWLFSAVGVAISPIGAGVCFVASAQMYFYLKNDFFKEMIKTGIDEGMTLSYLNDPTFKSVVKTVVGSIGEILLQPMTFTFAALLAGTIGLLLQYQALRLFTITLSSGEAEISGVLAGLGVVFARYANGGGQAMGQFISNMPANQKEGSSARAANILVVDPRS